MKFRLAAKLALVLGLMGLLGAASTGFYIHNANRQRLEAAAQTALTTSTQVLGRRIATVRGATARHLALLAQHPDAIAMLQTPTASSQQQVLTLFHLLLQANPEYLQIRLISAANHGLEVVRVDRDGGQTVTVPEADLQEKGHYPYVSDTLKLAPGTTYLSRFMINHERGTPSVQDQPTAQLAMPVSGGGSAPLGLVVINLDIGYTFKWLSTDLPSDFAVYLANQQGDFLVHPDGSKTFGFDKGKRHLIQDEFPATAPLVTGQATQVVLKSPATELHPSRVASFKTFPVAAASAEPALILGLAQPLSSLEEEATRLRNHMLQIMLAVGGMGLLLAVVLARLLTRPLAELTTAAQRFANTQTPGPLPLRRQDEIGDLARTFQVMAEQIHDQMHSLQENQEEFEFLAHHDSLTNLPNRRMLQDRLTQAIAHAKRREETVTLLFVDLDKFKDINDRLGHDAGDTVLSTVAQRLRQSMRGADTVARLGGDEFVILLDGLLKNDEIERVVNHLRQTVKAPIEAHGEALEVSVSIGISQYPLHGRTAEELLASADQAMYRVKTHGRDGFAFALQSENPLQSP